MEATPNHLRFMYEVYSICKTGSAGTDLEVVASKLKNHLLLPSISIDHCLTNRKRLTNEFPETNRCSACCSDYTACNQAPDRNPHKCCHPETRVSNSKNTYTSKPKLCSARQITKTSSNFPLEHLGTAIHQHDTKKNGNNKLPSGDKARSIIYDPKNNANISCLHYECSERRIEHVMTVECILTLLLPHIHDLYTRINKSLDTTPAIILTEREKETLEWMQIGKSNWEISQILGISQRTVKFHIKNIFEKLNVQNRVQAVAKAHNLGIL